MSFLISELEKDHVIMTEAIEKVRKAGVSTKEGQQMLMSIKAKLLDHLRKEDTNLYPVLRKSAEKDGGLKQTLDFFAKDMDEISKSALVFFEKYSKAARATSLLETSESSPLRSPHA